MKSNMCSSATISCHYLTKIVLGVFYMFLCVRLIEGKAVALTEDNFDKHVAANELVFLNFYADWCRFSQTLAPDYEEAAAQIATEFPESGRVLFARIDSIKEEKLASRFKITKYPTLKLIRSGKLIKREYRGNRSIEGLTGFIRNLLKDPIIELKSQEDVQNVAVGERALIYYMQNKVQDLYDVFLKVAMELRDDCHFYFAQGELASANLGPGGSAKIIFKPAKSKVGENSDEYNGALQSFDELSAWSSNKCVPLVREITFENAEEMTEEGLPFLILFYHPDDTESSKIYSEVIHKEMLEDRAHVNFLMADGVKFSHPLRHLGRTEKDLPLICIDSFRHMYIFDDFKNIRVPGKLKQFVEDLLSGKLHREFHYGPDQPETQPSQWETNSATDPPKSTFKKLGPSRNRYTLLRDEL